MAKRESGTRSSSAGQFRSHRVTIWAPEGTSNAHAGAPTAIAKGVPVKIAALPLQFQQNERLASGGLQSQTYYDVEMRVRPDMQMDFELHEECHTQRVFQILSEIPTDRMDALKYTCVVGSR